MKAAVVTAFDSPPRYLDHPLPAPKDEDEILVDVLASGLHPRVRSQASGTHYTSTEELPLVPGIDGVGRDPQGRLRYFVLPDTNMGAMAEKTVIDVRRSIVLPDGADPIQLAAAMNPAMASWIALRQRIEFKSGQSVLVLGATGSAGELAIEVAKRFGASEVFASGRNEERLARLASRAKVGPLRDAAEVDVVLDFTWGEPTARAMIEVVTNRKDRDRPLTWIEIGSVAGPTAAIPSAALRAARLSIVGSGQGSVSTRAILKELPALAEAITSGALPVDVRKMPLAEVETAWADAARTRERIVIQP